LVNNDSGGGSDSRITASLSPGVYYIEATSLIAGKTGDYKLLVSPLTLSFASPSIAVQGAVVSVSLFGNAFVSPMTVRAGTGISVSNVVVSNSTFALTTFTIAPDAPLGPHDVSVTTPGGTTNVVTFTVMPAVQSMVPINVGDTLPGTLSVTDPAAPHRSG